MKVSVQLSAPRRDSSRPPGGVLHDIHLDTALTLSAALRERATVELEALILVDNPRVRTTPRHAHRAPAWAAWCQRRLHLPGPPA